MTDNTMPDIAQTVIEHKKGKIEVWPVRSNYASEAGHPCERYLYYQRTAWEKKEPHDVTLQFIFDGGNTIEELAMKELKEAGFKIVEGQRYFQWKDLQVSGRVDFRIPVNRHLIPVEVKGLNHREWSNLNSVQDMLDSKAPWVQRYPAQLLLYQMMSEEEWGLFYIKSKSTYVPKCIWVHLYDWLGYLDTVVDKIERVNKAVETGEVPDRMEFDEKISPDCPYFTLCQPDLHLGEGAELLVDSELEEALERREELKEGHKEYEEVDKYVKAKVKGLTKGIIGNFLITGREVERKGYTVGPGSYWTTKIARIPSPKGS
jgi:hypothetical protein